MIKMTDILTAINRNVINHFPEVHLDSLDLSEKFQRPSFRTEIDGLKTSPMGTRYKERSFLVRVYYFPEKKQTEESNARFEKLLITDGLEDAFLQTLEVTPTFFLPIDEVRFSETDGVLVMEFDTLSIEEVENNFTYKLMEEINVSLQNNRL